MSNQNSTGLLDALLAVQAEAPTLPKNGLNPHFQAKFTPLDTIVEKIGPILNRHGLVWMTKPGVDAHGNPALHYTLAHAASGEREEGTMALLLTRQDPQGQGSAITYARRYSICAVLNLVADDDDDGHAARSSRQDHGSSDEPTAPQMKELGRQVKMAQPSGGTLRLMLNDVGAQFVTDEQIHDGSWATLISRAQVSGMLDVFKSGVLPTGHSDIPNDDEPPLDVEPGDDIPFDAVGAEHES